MKAKRIYTEKRSVKFPEDGIKMGFPGKSVPAKMEVHKTMVRARFSQQPTPLNDFMNFKRMSGNEILLNLDNYENFTSSEMVSGLIELGKRDAKMEHDWNNHPITFRCLEDFKRRLPTMNSKNVL
jgi:hypothetical protein